MRVWDKLSEPLRQRIGEEDFCIWFETLDEPVLENNELSFFVPNQYYLDKLTDKFYNQLKESVHDSIGGEIKIEFRIRERTSSPELSYSRPARPVPAGKSQITLLSHFTFDSFVVGESNQFAYAAATAVADSLGNSYNPLFIYGGVGLGKTHLMHAIGQRVLEKNPSAKVVYSNSEQFSNELAGAIKDQRTEAFRRKHREVDLLLIDDIQFLSERGDFVQKEFFHTFNRLHESKKQLVISSDRAAKDLPDFEKRLITRFQWGLSTDILPPNLETRIAILKKKAEEVGVYVPDEILHYIAHNIQTNIRSLEGALNRVVSYANFTRQDLTVTLVKEELKDLIYDKWQNKVINISDIQKTVAEFYHLTVSDLKAKKKAGAVSYPRQIAMYLARELTELSLVEIGQHFGGRDHTTVIYAYKKISKVLEEDENAGQIIQAIKDRL